MSDATAILRLAFATDAVAARVEAVLRVDDDAFAATTREGHVVVVALRGATVGSLLRAVDDVLSNAVVSEDLIT